MLPVLSYGPNPVRTARQSTLYSVPATAPAARARPLFGLRTLKSSRAPGLGVPAARYRLPRLPLSSCGAARQVGTCYARLYCTVAMATRRYLLPVPTRSKGHQRCALDAAGVRRRLLIRERAVLSSVDVHPPVGPVSAAEDGAPGGAALWPTTTSAAARLTVTCLLRDLEAA